MKPKVLNFLPALPTTKEEFDNEVCKRARMRLKRESVCVTSLKDHYYWNQYNQAETYEKKDAVLYMAARVVEDETRLWDGH